MLRKPDKNEKKYIKFLDKTFKSNKKWKFQRFFHSRCTALKSMAKKTNKINQIGLIVLQLQANLLYCVTERNKKRKCGNLQKGKRRFSLFELES